MASKNLVHHRNPVAIPGLTRNPLNSTRLNSSKKEQGFLNPKDKKVDRTVSGIDPKARLLIIFSALTALFLGAMDALIMSAAMPTIVSELGELHLYSWVYSAYFLSRAVSLPVFGKLADLYNNKRIFLISIGIFLLSSVAAGLSPNMIFLIVCRVFQGIGAGGNFALVYIVLADISEPGKRAKTMSFASSIWGIASVLGPTLGGFIVTYFSWRWIFFINIPLGLFSLAGIAFFMIELREKKKEVTLDISGVWTLSLSITGLLMIFLMGGREYPWGSMQILALVIITVLSGMGFIYSEKRAKEPILPLRFFRKRGFSLGNGAVFLSSFSIFAMFAFAPVFIQGALGKSPMQVGIAMLSLSLGWSIGSLALGQMSHWFGIKRAAVMGSVFLFAGCGLTLLFTTETSMVLCFFVFQIVGLGMGFVTLSTLVIVQNTIDISDLGVATSSHQFARTLGGTVGVGICGGFLTTRLMDTINSLKQTGIMDDLPKSLAEGPGRGFENLLRPEFQSLLSEKALDMLQQSIASSVSVVFWIAVMVSLLCFSACLILPGSGKVDRE
jgi:EmrB/QacA subfamily drug resistance transporter